jgi:hypothetical protein
MLRSAAERFGARLAIEDGPSAHLRRAGRRGPFRSARPWWPPASSPAIGWPSGRSTASSGWWPCSVCPRPGAVLVPVNTRFKGGEAATSLTRSRARVLVTVTDFLGTDYVEMLRSTGTRTFPTWRPVVVARGGAPDGTEPWVDFLGPGHGRRAGRRRSAAQPPGPDDPSDILFTSGTTGLPKGVVMTHGRTLCVATDWVADDRAVPRRPLPDGEPVLPHVRTEGGHPGLRGSGATMLPERSSTSTASWAASSANG